PGRRAGTGSPGSPSGEDRFDQGPAGVGDITAVRRTSTHPLEGGRRSGAHRRRGRGDAPRAGPDPEVLWRKPPVLATAALPGTTLGRLGGPSTGSPTAWAAAGAAIRKLHDAPPLRKHPPSRSTGRLAGRELYHVARRPDVSLQTHTSIAQQHSRRVDNVNRLHNPLQPGRYTLACGTHPPRTKRVNGEG